MTTRREVLQLGGAGALGIIGMNGGEDAPTTSTTPLQTSSLLAPHNVPVPYDGVFRRPPVLIPDETGFDDGDPTRPFERFALTQNLVQAQLVPGLSTTIAGYNGIFPGPTIRACQGTRPEVRMRNGLPQAGLLHPGEFRTVTHLHGSASLPQFDGYANDFTAPGHVENYHDPNWQTARTLWHHDHNHHVTAQNVYSGLAGYYPLADRYDKAQFPQVEHDVPLMVSAALFNADGSLGYDDNNHKGLWGDVIMVNGVPWPAMKVKPRLYRVRALVASISRPRHPTLPTGDRVFIGGTDAGMVPVVQAVKSWQQGTAERCEKLIHFPKYLAGQRIELRDLSNKNNVDFTNTNKIMRFEVMADSGPASMKTIPARLDDGGAPNLSRGGGNLTYYRF